jgi:hypothetical protein
VYCPKKESKEGVERRIVGDLLCECIRCSHIKEARATKELGPKK